MLIRIQHGSKTRVILYTFVDDIRCREQPSVIEAVNVVELGSNCNNAGSI